MAVATTDKVAKGTRQGSRGAQANTAAIAAGKPRCNAATYLQPLALKWWRIAACSCRSRGRCLEQLQQRRREACGGWTGGWAVCSQQVALRRDAGTGQAVCMCQ